MSIVRIRVKTWRVQESSTIRVSKSTDPGLMIDLELVHESSEDEKIPRRFPVQEERREIERGTDGETVTKKELITRA